MYEVYTECWCTSGCQNFVRSMKMDVCVYTLCRQCIPVIYRALISSALLMASWNGHMHVELVNILLHNRASVHVLQDVSLAFYIA